MFHGMGSITLDNTVDVCIDSFQLTETLNLYTYDYLRSADHYLSPAPLSAKPKSRRWAITLTYPSHNQVFHSLLESDLARPGAIFTPTTTLSIQGPNGLQGRVDPGATIRGFNLTKGKKIEPLGITFPDADPADIIYVAIDFNNNTDLREQKAPFVPGLTFSFSGDIYIDRKPYKLMVDKMAPSNLITIKTGGTPSVKYEVIGGLKLFTKK